MQKVIKSYLIICIVLMMMFAGCGRKIAGENEGTPGNNQSPAASQGTVANEDQNNEKYLQKINQLKEETNKYDKSLAPNQKSKINNTMNSLLHEILAEKASIKALPEDILMNNKDFYLKFSKEYLVNNYKYRIIELGSKAHDMGTSIDLYIQCLKDDTVLGIAKVYTAVQGANSTELKYSNITIDNGKAYLVILDEFYGPDSPLLRLYSYENDGLNWVLSNNCDDINNEYWKSEKNSESIIIKSYKVNYNGKNDFDITSDNDELQLKIKDKGNNSVLDSRKVVLTAGKIKLQ